MRAQASQMGRVHRVVKCGQGIHVPANVVLVQPLEIINQSISFSHIQHNSNHKKVGKNISFPRFREGTRAKWQVQSTSHRYNQSCFFLEITLSHDPTIVAISQRPHQRVKSESKLSCSFERQRSSRQSLKERNERQSTTFPFDSQTSFQLRLRTARQLVVPVVILCILTTIV